MLSGDMSEEFVRKFLYAVEAEIIHELVIDIKESFAGLSDVSHKYVFAVTDERACVFEGMRFPIPVFTSDHEVFRFAGAKNRRDSIAYCIRHVILSTVNIRVVCWHWAIGERVLVETKG
ncbi:hypothetical protein C463_12347 [Halorubrum californiense DSM 19288]|uniref:Uncharacterized protein n=1 Tax=Halorubrum californiense DSM 19288 TaxID=1227465 RepID=M0E125_9EURY|nr:hypothetical protein C463_12347 [Halorubrum californiense DSM 19288]